VHSMIACGFGEVLEEPSALSCPPWAKTVFVKGMPSDGPDWLPPGFQRSCLPAPAVRFSHCCSHQLSGKQHVCCCQKLEFSPSCAARAILTMTDAITVYDTPPPPLPLSASAITSLHGNMHPQLQGNLAYQGLKPPTWRTTTSPGCSP
jgi:hypothetical protein